MIIIDHELKEELINQLSQKAQTAVIVVEGKNDKKALQKMGVKGDFFLLKNIRKSLRECAEQIAQNHNKAILCLDFDKTGRDLTKKMKTNLQKEGVKTNTKICYDLLKICNSNTVEGLST